MDASRQNRQPDPNIVPIQPRRKVDSDAQEDTAGVEAKPPADATRGEYVKGKSEDAAEALSTTEESHLNSNSDVLLGPSMSMHVDGSQPEANSMAPQKLEASTKFVLADFGGAWGAGAAPGSVLAKLMEEQEKLQQPQQQQQHQPRDGGVVHARPLPLAVIRWEEQLPLPLTAAVMLMRVKDTIASRTKHTSRTTTIVAMEFPLLLRHHHLHLPMKAGSFAEEGVGGRQRRHINSNSNKIPTIHRSSSINSMLEGEDVEAFAGVVEAVAIAAIKARQVPVVALIRANDPATIPGGADNV